LLSKNFSSLEFSKSVECWLISAGLCFDNSHSVFHYQEQPHSDFELYSKSTSSSSVIFTSKIHKLLKIFIPFRFLFMRSDGKFNLKAKLISVTYRLIRHRFLEKAVNAVTKLMIRIYQIRKI
jgi:hypothetical protein